ncbi:MAG: hypothetical protein KatS3mg059_0501 [Thermomicrobiales bacterium]|nr:MAG: hypothetical protein KatS3mg059_0501 [Thermomicrobiales bacterium]
MSLHGCFPILCTPFLDDGSLDLGSLEREVDWVIGEGASGVVALAIASEGYKLTEAERDDVARVVIAPPRTGCQSSSRRTATGRRSRSTAPGVRQHWVQAP